MPSRPPGVQHSAIIDISETNCAAHCRAGFWYNNCADNHGHINQATDAPCGGFSWDKTNPHIELKETKLYLSCTGATLH